MGGHAARAATFAQWLCRACRHTGGTPQLQPGRSPSTRSPPALQIRWRLSDEPLAPGEAEQHPERAAPGFRAACRAKIFLGYTSNLVSAGVREHIRYLVQVTAPAASAPEP